MTATQLQQSETQFQQAIVDLARALGWLVYHTHDSRHSAPGFPDLVLVRNGSLIFAELKTERGRVSGAQEEWLRNLADVEGVVWEGSDDDAEWIDRIVRVRTWRASDWPEIERVLRR
jgi:VRR-NUC domain